MALMDVAKTLGVPKFSIHLTKINVLLDEYQRLYKDLNKYLKDREGYLYTHTYILIRFYEFMAQTA